MLRSSIFRLALITAALTASLVGVATASAATYCVGDAACVAGGGTDTTLAAAVAASNVAADADTIRIGAGTFEVAGALTANALRPVTITGSGIGATTLHFGTGVGIALLDGESSISHMTIDNDNTGGSGLTVENLTFPREIENVHDLLMVGDGYTGVTATGEIRIARVDVRMRTADVSGPATGIFVTARTGKVARISDSSFRGTDGMVMIGSGEIRASGVSVVYARYGVAAAGGGLNDNLNVRLTGVTTRYQEEASVVVDDAAIRASTDGGASGSQTVNVSSYNSTHIAPSTGAAAAHVYNVVALGATNPGTSSATVTVRGSIAHGPFAKAAFVNQLNNGRNLAQLYITTSSIDVSGMRLDTDNSAYASATGITFEPDPKFVDLAGGDYHLRHDSPLLDLGVTTNEAWEDGLDRDRRTRPVWKDGSAAPSPKHDFGAYEYHRLAPTAAILGGGTVTPGSAVTLSSVASDPNAGETASLAYAWTLPGGGTSTASSVSFAAPTADGTYPVTLVVTDVTGRASVAATATLTVSTPVPPVVVAPKDSLAPRLTFAKLTGRLPLILKRKALVAKYTLDEAADVKLSLVATVTRPPLRKGGKVRISTAVVATTSVTQLKGVRSIKLVPSVVGLKRLAMLRKAKGAKLAGWAVTGTVRDDARNARTVRATVKVTVR